MIGYLRGEILEHSDGKIVLLVGGIGPSASGVGYLLSAPQSAEYGAYRVGQDVAFYIHTHVREEALDLYAFGTRGEKELFLTLLDVNGIGPKLALGLLSKIQPAQLVQAVLDENKGALTEIPGIGKKTAERMVLELGDKFRKKMEAGAFEGIGVGGEVGLRDNRSLGMLKQVAAGGSAVVAMFKDAKEALIGLGYREQDVTPVLNRVLVESESPPRQAEDLVKSALRQLL
jgi:holliday junction DNA helicase RuvA